MTPGDRLAAACYWLERVTVCGSDVGRWADHEDAAHAQDLIDVVTEGGVLGAETRDWLYAHSDREMCRRPIVRRFATSLLEYLEGA